MAQFPDLIKHKAWDRQDGRCAAHILPTYPLETAKPSLPEQSAIPLTIGTTEDKNAVVGTTDI